MAVEVAVVTPDGDVLNSLTLHLVNKRDESVTYALAPAEAGGALRYEIPAAEVELGALESRRLTILVTRPEGAAPTGGQRELVRIEIIDDPGGEARVVEIPFIAPNR